MDKPEKVGHYWYKFGNKPWSIVLVCAFEGRLYARADDVYWLDEANGWVEFVTAWYGPLTPPDPRSAKSQVRRFSSQGRSAIGGEDRSGSAGDGRGRPQMHGERQDHGEESHLANPTGCGLRSSHAGRQESRHLGSSWNVFAHGVCPER